MSGIAGLFGFNGSSFSPDLISNMTAAMADRGPDGIHHWVSGSVALGHCMLRTTPEAATEHQPLVSHDGHMVLVFDGRIDNRIELRQSLISHGLVLRGQSDAELVLTAYQQWQDDVVEHLLGDFAFVVWNSRRQQMFCARDHFGVKPFYYCISSNYFAFASEEEALLNLPGVSGGPNEDRIASLLAPQFSDVDPGVSWLEDVLKLGSGQTLNVFNNGKIRGRIYWLQEPMEEIDLSSDYEYEEAFREVFYEAVRCRLHSQGSPAVMLSGGIDSASIAGVGTLERQVKFWFVPHKS